MPTFSVILTTYGRQSLLDQAIRSVLDQTIDDFELIVVDDGSEPPATVPEDPRIRIVRHDDNRGIAASRNSGMAAAIGGYLTFLDDDDIYDARRLELVYDVIGEVPITLCWASYLGEATTGRYLEGDVSAEIVSRTTPPLGAATVRRSVARRFSTAYEACEDVEWWIRMSDHPVKTVPAIGYWVRKHDGPRVRHGTRVRIDSSYQLLREHASYFRQNRRAAAFRWKRIGLMHLEIGERWQAFRALSRSTILAPMPRTLRHLVRVLRPSSQGPARTSGS